MIYALMTAGLALLVATFYTPICWVSLTAPNYPKQAFAEGVRIEFYMNGVF